jgi:hypothetical protein
MGSLSGNSMVTDLRTLTFQSTLKNYLTNLKTPRSQEKRFPMNLYLTKMSCKHILNNRLKNTSK